MITSSVNVPKFLGFSIVILSSLFLSSSPSHCKPLWSTSMYAPLPLPTHLSLPSISRIKSQFMILEQRNNRRWRRRRVIGNKEGKKQNRDLPNKLSGLLAAGMMTGCLQVVGVIWFCQWEQWYYLAAMKYGKQRNVRLFPYSFSTNVEELFMGLPDQTRLAMKGSE